MICIFLAIVLVGVVFCKLFGLELPDTDALLIVAVLLVGDAILFSKKKD